MSQTPVCPLTPATVVPALRPVEVVPASGADGQRQFLLHDPRGLAEAPLVVSLAGYFILAHFDGRHVVADVQAAFARHFDVSLPLEQLQELIGVLDAALLLDNERAANAQHAAREAYLRAAVRDSALRWPDADALRGQLEPLIAGPTAHAGPAAAGIIAPHLDYARGSPCYREAYAALAQAGPAERYVILGTNHFGERDAVVATDKTFRTPLGDVPVDVEFLTAIERRLGESLRDGQSDHQREHSVELQVHLLQALQRTRPFRIVPLLCPDPCGPSGTAPASGRGPDLGAVSDVIAAELAGASGRTVLIAGADLSHVGERFGDAGTLGTADLADVQRFDRDLLAMLEARNPRGFLDRVRAVQNATRICSVGCIYALVRALPGRTCRILGYHQAVDWESSAHVSCCAAVLY